MTYLTLDLIKQHLNINSGYTADDSYLTMLGGVVEEVVEKHIDDSLECLYAHNGDKLPLPLIQACLLLLGTYYSNRENIAFTSSVEIPMSFSYLLDLYKNYAGVQDGDTPSTLIEEIQIRLARLETYKEYDSEKTITGEGLSVTTTGTQTQIKIDKVDSGEY